MRIFSILLLIGSFILLIGVAFSYNNKKKQLRVSNASELVDIHFWDLLPVPSLDRSKIINDSLKSFDAFIRSSTVAEKAAATCDPLGNISRMTRYYNSRPMEVLPGKPSLKSLAMIRLNGVDHFVLALDLIDGTGASEVWELVFMKDDEGMWKLDWPNFTRYQNTAWKDFVRGDGPDESEFKLWVMRESALDTENEYCLKFYEPPANGNSELGVSCPNIMVRKDSPMGRKIYRMLRINELQNDAYRNVFPLNLGKNHMRITAVLSKQKNRKTGEWTYSLKRIIGEGWFSSLK